MSRWLLDTNACIRVLNGRAPALRDRVRAAARIDLCVCSVVKAELYAGAARSLDPAKARMKQDRFLAGLRSYPFEDASAERYGQLRAHLENAGTPIGGNDMLIAAIALGNGLTLISANVAEFSLVPGLRVENWEA